jgi:hypothetical protein
MASLIFFHNKPKSTHWLSVYTRTSFIGRNRYRIKVLWTKETVEWNTDLEELSVR